jgi:hypothetical protein
LALFRPNDVRKAKKKKGPDSCEESGPLGTEFGRCARR